MCSLFTEFWVEAEQLERHGIISKHSHMHAGLFQGSRTLDSALGQQHQRFSIFDEIQVGTSYTSKPAWLFILFFVALGLLWTSVGIIVSLLCTSANETRTIAGPPGLYLWSALGVVSFAAAIGIFVWQFHWRMVDNVLLPEQLQAGFSSKGLLSLGYSFYCLVYAVAALVAPCVFTFVTSEEPEDPSSKQPLADGTVFLY
ncbi:Clarin-3 [Aphelenchoides avenae]|nr:Clarin-3 [Aphelenchus avenae]